MTISCQLSFTILVMTRASELWEHQKYLIGRCKEDGARLCSLVPSEGSCHKLGHRRLTLNKVVKTTLLRGQWALAQVVQRRVGVSFLGEIFISHLDMVLALCGPVSAGGGLMDLRTFLPISAVLWCCAQYSASSSPIANKPTGDVLCCFWDMIFQSSLVMRFSWSNFWHYLLRNFLSDLIIHLHHQLRRQQ